MRQHRPLLRAALAGISLSIVLAACGGSGSGSGSTTPPPAAKFAISGSPNPSAVVGQSYSVQVSVSDPSGSVTYSAAGLPAWLSFNSSTGMLTGTPVAADVGMDSGIVLSASDGSVTVSLPSFSINVSAAGSGSGSASLSWTIPTQNADGSTLTDLAGFKVLYGQSPQDLNQQVVINNPSVSNYLVENLASGTWYFAIVSVNSAGVSSVPTNVASIQI
jgi:hypothetical protein